VGSLKLRLKKEEINPLTNTSQSPPLVSQLFQIVMPVFNEERVLENVLENAKEFAYLTQMVVVNDASTDSTKGILERWQRDEGLSVIHLTENAKKEGAILEAMETLRNQDNLRPYIILLDADTRLQQTKTGKSVFDQLVSAISYLEQKKLGAMALRVNAAFFKSPNIYWMSAYAIYFALQFDCWLLGMQGKLWVINGAGGLFHSNELLLILRGLTPNFETGDLQITLELMKSGRKIALYNDIVALTYVPETLRGLFNQRRRWERGTIKVLWEDRIFYGKLFLKPSLLAIVLILHLALYIGIFLTVLGYFYREFITAEFLYALLVSSFIWYTVDILKGALVAYRTDRSKLLLFYLCAFVNAPVWLLVVLPARVFGGLEAVCYIIKLNMSKKK
jgi:poly-beta-1,6-N-acetyl-D-glucosamine synthase